MNSSFSGPSVLGKKPGAAVAAAVAAPPASGASRPRIRELIRVASLDRVDGTVDRR
jgi:hypothetical protein